MARPVDWWEDLYRTSPISELPWFTTELDQDLRKALETFGPPKGRILDLGTGPGTHAVGFARLGYDVVATDISPSAVDAARKHAKETRVKIDFHVDNILRSNLRDGFVDAVMDRGVFHVLPPENRPGYVDAVHRILRAHGLLHLKCFSDKEPGDWGPYRISRAELRSHFRRSFDVLSIKDAVFQGNVVPHPRALIATFRRR